MIGYYFFTLFLAETAATTSTPSNPNASYKVTATENIIPYEYSGTEVRVQAPGTERICDLTLCTGVDFSGHYYQWRYYKDLCPTAP
ncbi:hypothetical protein ColLi_00129 [Colletotrichum liriopes]|uniref:Uncharacterized protein n=1 Tax=Colletotrichum liriopes TaxID=708192 RepID=A0AA37LLX9_9PEZI|nr:hypothetical protein ColLi_00129 [Colletotrichum liriopes]